MQASFFNEVWFSPAVGFDVAAGKVRLYGAGDRPVSYIALDDVARAIVACVGNQAVSRKTIEVGGPAAVAPRNAVQLFEQARGRSFDVEFFPLAGIRGAQAGTRDPLMASFLGLFEALAVRGDAIDPAWQSLLGVQAQPLPDWIKDHCLAEDAARRKDGSGCVR